MTDNEYIQHWGIKGMRWGVRRYQNADGTLTDLGKKRYQKEFDALSKKKQKDYKANPNKWVEEDLSGRKRVVESVGRLSSDLQNMPGVRDNKKIKKMNLSDKTDKELRDAINRELLERQYSQVFNSDSTRNGKEVFREVLQDVGGVTAVAASSLGVALAIKQLKG